MTADELRQSMKTALVNERDAIRRLDADAVTRAANEKERLMGMLVATTDPKLRTELVEALAELKTELRRNLVLLAHARDYLRDAVELCRPSQGRPRLEAKL
jgi:hypothetical protein